MFRRNGSGMIPLVGVRRVERPNALPAATSNSSRRGRSRSEPRAPVGARFTLERIGHDEQRYTTRLFGYIPGVSLLVETPLADGGVVMFREGESCIARAFSGTDAFAFSAIVLSVRYTHRTPISISPIRSGSAAHRCAPSADGA